MDHRRWTMEKEMDHGPWTIDDGRWTMDKIKRLREERKRKIPGKERFGQERCKIPGKGQERLKEEPKSKIKEKNKRYKITTYS